MLLHATFVDYMHTYTQKPHCQQGSLQPEDLVTKVNCLKSCAETSMAQGTEPGCNNTAALT